MQLPALFKDARYFQIIFQSAFLSYGLFFLHWDNEAWLYTTYFITSLISQFICELIFGKKEVDSYLNQVAAQQVLILVNKRVFF